MEKKNGGGGDETDKKKLLLVRAVQEKKGKNRNKNHEEKGKKRIKNSHLSPPPPKISIFEIKKITGSIIHHRTCDVSICLSVYLETTYLGPRVFALHRIKINST